MQASLAFSNNLHYTTNHKSSIVSLNQPIKSNTSFTGASSVTIAKAAVNAGERPVSWFVEKAANLIGKGNTITKYENLPKAIRIASENGMLTSTLIACILGTTIRPLTIMALPGNKEDNKYAAVKSIATGIVSLCLVGATLLVLNKGLDNAGEKLKEILFKKAEMFKPEEISLFLNKAKPDVNVIKDTITEAKFLKFEEIGKTVEAFKKLCNYTSKYIIAPFEALALFSLMPVVMNKVFPKKKTAPGQNLPIYATQLSGIKDTTFKSFLSQSKGVK